MIRIYFFFLLTYASLLPATELPIEHRWTNSEVALLKTLWIDNFKLEKDKTNRVVTNPAAVALGHKIFFDLRFSLNGKIACASCHMAENYFTDGLDTAEGIKKGSRNTPTIVGSSQHVWFFHDGRSDSLWSQALGPLENALEHGGSRAKFAHVVFNDAVLRQTYEKIFNTMPDITDKKRFPLNAGPIKNKIANKAWGNMSKEDRHTINSIFVNIGKTLAAYESKLQPAASRFDYYIEAISQKNKTEILKQLSSDEAKGLRLFISKAKCVVCHSGSMLTDKGFHNISVPARKDASGKGMKHDWGRYKGAQQVLKSPFNCRSLYNDAVLNSTAKQCDELEYMLMDRHETQGAMKTPSLRNVAKTAPYMHAGQLKTLRDVIEHYNNPPDVTFRRSELFLNFDLSELEVNQLLAFLKSLNSPINAEAKWLKSP